VAQPNVDEAPRWCHMEYADVTHMQNAECNRFSSATSFYLSGVLTESRIELI
jgi:hypothetical protein